MLHYIKFYSVYKYRSNTFSVYIKMTTDYYQKNNGRVPMRHVKGIKIFLKKKKTFPEENKRCIRMKVTATKIFLKIKNKEK